ncbi:MAG: transposase, partial [Albidovulum sp.]|nr:transposase [Albidovulum sp.]
LLGDFEGALLSDGNRACAAYAESRNGAAGHASCWAHARREFEKAKDSEPRLAAEALDLIGALQLCEREIRKRKLEGREKLEFRRTRSRPVANAFWNWCARHFEDPRHPPKSPIVKALNYALNRRGQLEAWLSDPEVPIDTNHLERGLRVLPLGRKNWLFCWTEVGAEAVGIVQSPVATCRLQGVDPRAYLEDVLQRVSVHPSSRVQELTPRLWKDLFAGDPMKSDLGTGVECRASDPPNGT